MQVGMIKTVDKYVGIPLCILLAIARLPFAIPKSMRNIQIENPKKILVIQLWGVGETITTLPALKALRKKFSNAEISVLATNRNKDVYFKNKDIDNIIELDVSLPEILKFISGSIREYDLVVDMEEYLNVSSMMAFFLGKSRIGFDHGARALLYTKKTLYNDMQHSVFTFMNLAELLGAKMKIEKLPGLNFDAKDEKEVNSYLKGKKIAKKDFVVGIAPGAAESAPSRKWLKERYAKFADTILEKYAKKNCRIVFIGSSDERALINEIMTMMAKKENVYNAAGLFTLRQTFHLIKKCKAFVGNDSGPMHIAAAQGVKTLGLFGPNTPVRWAPFGKGNAFVYVRESCDFTPCINTHEGQVPDCLYRKDSSDYQKCMKAITVDNVLMAFAKIVKR